MENKAVEFYNGLKGKKVAFIGAGVSHKTLIKMFTEYGAKVTLCDKRSFQSSAIMGMNLKN